MWQGVESWDSSSSSQIEELDLMACMAINRDTMVASVGDGALRAEVVDGAGVLGTWVDC